MLKSLCQNVDGVLVVGKDSVLAETDWNIYGDG